MDADIHFKSLTEVAAKLKAREITSRELTEHMLDRIARLDGKLQAFVHVMPETARNAAEEADAEIAKGNYLGPLHGMPIVVKDLFYTTDAPTGGGTTIYKDFMAPHDATVVTRLREAGAVILGKVKTTEGAFFSHHPAIAAPINPWKADRWSGISSSGSGVSVAAGLAFAALGSDTGGSIRMPSTCNGLTGLKPTYGRVSRHGVFVLAESLDHVGPMARNARDAAAMLSIIAGADPNDPTALRNPVPDYLANAPVRLEGWRIGVDTTFENDSRIEAPVKKAIAGAVAAFARLGARIVPMLLPDPSAVLQTGVLRIMAEAAKAHAATFPSRAEEYGPDLRLFLSGAEHLKQEDLAKAQAASEEYRKRFLALYDEVDLVLMPAIPIAVPDRDVFANRVREAGSAASVVGLFTIILDVAGVPTLTLPGGFDSDGVPVGFQIVGNLLDEERVLEAGHAFQNITDWHTRHPAF